MITLSRVALIAMILLLFGCTSYQSVLEDQPVVNETGRTIVISDYRFNPQTITINAGESITWKNLDRDEHTLMYENTESDPLQKGESFTVEIDKPGTYNYASGNHPFMEGTIIVQ